jgi:5-methylcytosine-specific restriction enzyme B
MPRFTKMEFPELYKEFIDSGYLGTLEGMRHLDAYEEGRKQGRLNYRSVLEARERGEDVTDLILLKLLPHNDTVGNRERGAWVHIAPAIQGNVKRWFAGARWTRPEDWPAIADAILRFVQRCNDDPEQLPEACAEFARLPYAKGFQTGMLTPILNALRPEDYLLVKYKSRQTIDYFSGGSYGPGDVPEGYALVEGGKVRAGMLVRDIGGDARPAWRRSGPSGHSMSDYHTGRCLLPTY